VFEPDKAKPTANADCAWNSTEGQSKDVGRPPTSGIPKSGIETMTITTNQGVIRAAIDVSKVPCAAASFSFLAEKKYFDNTQCHRLTTEGGYVLQCGDPSATGNGGPGYRFADENLPTAEPPASDPAAASGSPSAAPAIYKAGMIAMANSGADTNGSQFFIVYKDSPVFQPNYTVLGQITQGLDVVEKIAAAGVAEGGSSASDGKPKAEVTIQTLTMGDAEPAPADSTSPGGSAPAQTPTPAASQ
jgi:peptidyl-prolyl cis-trans isomerase B (cyclophilin B)